MIEGVVVKKLKVVPDERGYLMECLRSDEEIFDKFGQCYISAVYKDVVKAWHYHKEQTDFVVCVSGMIKLVLCDLKCGGRPAIEEYFIGEQNPCLIKIPNNIYHGWKGLSGVSLVLNVPNKVYDYKNPDEYRIPPHPADNRNMNDRIDYDWGRKDG